MSLHDDIMNLAINNVSVCELEGDHILTYKAGHRDARHAAAELAIAADQRIEELEEALQLAISEYEQLPHSLGYEFTHLHIYLRCAKLWRRNNA